MSDAADVRDLRADTTLTPDAARVGRYRAEIPEGWRVVYVFGGVSMYTALRAMQEALDRSDLPLVTANAVFLAPVPPGAVEIDVEILRDGRNASQVAADLHVPRSGPALRVHGVFGRAHDTDLEFQDVPVPEVPLPHQCAPPPEPERPNPFGPIPFHDQTAWLPVSPLDDPGSGRFASWVRLERAARLPDGSLDPLTMAVHGDVLGPAVGRGLGPRETPTMVLSLEIGIRFIRTPATPWVLQEIEAWHVGSGYATGPARLWDEELRLCAIATQTAKVTRGRLPAPPPLPSAPLSSPAEVRPDARP
jgi:acyl-CoA thioesterase